ncbi:UNVERIFIED_CONTAM: hypothetical protein Sradi_6932400 [Sesamum radiatum]|uniref:Reverse transcriptase Ty1/copia-type domain-containing protein n=1 Tax=Sesamum radiatum TaxID=300843 RepID=A0AAW2JIW6_SESRA
MDVKTAFLNRFIEEEIYTDQPEGFTSVGEEQKVCHLQRSIYGLKQASQSWNIRFDEVIRGYDFIKNDFDPCVYKKVVDKVVKPTELTRGKSSYGSLGGLVSMTGTSWLRQYRISPRT